MFLWFLLAGLAGGVLGGMGMGGGTLLIPILTLVLNVPQQAAQCINLLAFVPMSLFALYLHFKNRLIEAKGLLYILVPAVIFAVISSSLAVGAPPELLKKLFGGFLIVLAIFGVVTSFVRAKQKN
ncbi:MAG: sulfite exporter TauE/SafE family protein [Clostridia bacterium]|nr:sulfite exporter TauE/SafE family protein [Clostridia bacterium]